MTTPEQHYRALLASHAPLVALVGNRIALNAIPAGGLPPLVVFVTTQTPEIALDGTVLATACSHSTQCWGKDSAQAQAIADAVRAAIATDPDYTVVGQESVFEEDLSLDGLQLTVERWVT